jgi:hypothetical protein
VVLRAQCGAREALEALRRHEEVLRRSLDAVDRHRNRLIIGVVVTVLAPVGALIQGGFALHSRNANVFRRAGGRAKMRP